MRLLAGLFDCFLALVVSAKCYAYLRELAWFWCNGKDVLLPEYRRDPIRTYQKDIALGRPRPLTSRFDVGKHRSVVNLVGIVFKTPTIVVLAAFGSIAIGPWVCKPIHILLAVVVCLLSVLALVAAVIGRLVLGPYDSLNPDLKVGQPLRSKLYNDGHTVGLYLLVLIVMTIVGFASVYANLGQAWPKAFSDGASADPVRWLYFTVTVASTVGFGDIYAKSDVVRTFVIIQMAAGSLLLAWAISVFLGEQLPAQVLQVIESAADMPDREKGSS